MKRSGPLRRTPLRSRSSRKARIDAARKILRKRLVDEDPMCRRCRVRPGTDLHERLRRSQGGDPTDELVIILVCRQCHSEIHAYPQRSREEGWLIFRKDLWPGEAA